MSLCSANEALIPIIKKDIDILEYVQRSVTKKYLDTKSWGQNGI